MEATPVDGVWYECDLDPSTAHVLIPYLGAAHAGAAPAGLQLAVTIYSDVPHVVGSGKVAEPEGAWKCEMCAAAFPRRVCPFSIVHSKMVRIEEIMDQRLVFLDQLIAQTA